MMAEIIGGLWLSTTVTFPDDETIRDWRKVIRCDSVVVRFDLYEFLLPHHKADRYFEGNRWNGVRCPELVAGSGKQVEVLVLV